MRVRRQYIAICSDLEGADCELTPIARHTERTSTLMPHASCLLHSLYAPCLPVILQHLMANAFHISSFARKFYWASFLSSSTLAICLSLSLPLFDSGNTHTRTQKWIKLLWQKAHVVHTSGQHTCTPPVYEPQLNCRSNQKKKKREEKWKVKNVIKFTSWEHKTLSSRQLRD